MVREQCSRSAGRKLVRILNFLYSGAEYGGAEYTMATNGALLSGFLRRLGGWGLHFRVPALTFAEAALDG
jgi:hypothetical protein